jgi:hypothetical protein
LLKKKFFFFEKKENLTLKVISNTFLYIFLKPYQKKIYFLKLRNLGVENFYFKKIIFFIINKWKITLIFFKSLKKIISNFF